MRNFDRRFVVTWAVSLACLIPLFLSACGQEPAPPTAQPQAAAPTPQPKAPPTPSTLPAAAPSDAKTAGQNSCVDCHRRKETVQAFPAWAQDQFIHWYGAVHGRVGVTCELCHGGNPSAWDKVEAHTGMLSSRDPQSKIYYKNVPMTCAQCHEAVYAEFERSNHYQELVADHLAPSCNTCHGFQMDVGAVTPAQILERCTLCHNAERGVKPEVIPTARLALDKMRGAKEAVEKAEVTVEVASDQGLDMSEEQALLAAAHEQLENTGAHWHSFRLHAFENEAAAIATNAQRAQQLAMDALLEK